MADLLSDGFEDGGNTVGVGDVQLMVPGFCPVCDGKFFDRF